MLDPIVTRISRGSRSRARAASLGLVVALFAAPHSRAEEPSTPVTPVTPVEGARPTVEKPSEPQPHTQTDRRLDERPAAARTNRKDFEPSEKIQVDSVVSFPVDI